MTDSEKIEPDKFFKATYNMGTIKVAMNNMLACLLEGNYEGAVGHYHCALDLCDDVIDAVDEIWEETP